MLIMFRLMTLAAFLAAMAFTTSSVSAADLPKTHVKVIGVNSTLNQAKMLERPFWEEIIPTESNGQVTADYISLTEVGIKGNEQLRLAKMGVLEFFSGNHALMAADDLMFDAADMIGVMPTIEDARKAMDAFRPVVAAHMEKFNVKLLMDWPNPSQVLYCKPKISGIADLKGKKVRVSTKGASDLVGLAGGTPLTIMWAEVIPAAQRGTIDCGITGTLSGNTGNWWEVFDYIHPLALTWGMWFHAVNLDTWNRLDPSVQAFFEEQFALEQERRWALAAEENQDGVNCNTGQGECKYGVQGSITLVPVTQADKDLLQSWVPTLSASWAKSCGADCVAEWNASMGKAIGMSLSAD
jgi:TRAP-type C4-dicarboxylate transport system substrate-binding protein